MPYDNHRQRCARFQGKKPPSRRHKKEYCESCFYRDQPETPAGSNDKKIALTTSVSDKKDILMPGDIAAPESFPADFTRKKTAIFSGLNNKACSHFTTNAPVAAGDTAYSQNGEISAVPQDGNAPGSKKSSSGAGRAENIRVINSRASSEARSDYRHAQPQHERRLHYFYPYKRA